MRDGNITLREKLQPVFYKRGYMKHVYTSLLFILFFNIILYGSPVNDKNEDPQAKTSNIDVLNKTESPGQDLETTGDSPKLNIELRERFFLYRLMLKTALKDGTVSEEETALLKTLAKELGLSADQVLSLRNEVIISLPKRLDQSGRWPLVLQNIAWGSGLYGWGVPYVVGADDPKWTVGMELMSFAGGFYFTHRYTKNMNIPHARAQMMRTGSGVGFLTGWSLNDLLKIWDNDDKEALSILMVSVPAGIVAGDWLYRKLEPSNGQAWSLTLWGTLSWYTLYQIHNIFEEIPETDYYDDYGDYHDTGDDDLIAWEQRQAALAMISYPLGIWAGHTFFGDRNYSFGDALMLVQGSGLGMLYGFILADLVGIDMESYGSRVFTTVGTIGGTVLMDRYIDRDDYTFGNAFLMALGTGSGILFNMGIGTILDIESETGIDLLVMSGGAAGFWLTRKIVIPEKENNLTRNASIRNISLSPTLLSDLSAPEKYFGTFVPGLRLDVEF